MEILTRVSVSSVLETSAESYPYHRTSRWLVSQLPTIFLWEEKLVAPLIATNDVNRAREKAKERQTMTTMIISRRKSHFCTTKWCELLVNITLKGF